MLPFKILAVKKGDVYYFRRVYSTQEEVLYDLHTRRVRIVKATEYSRAIYSVIIQGGTGTIDMIEMRPNSHRCNYYAARTIDLYIESLKQFNELIKTHVSL